MRNKINQFLLRLAKRRKNPDVGTFVIGGYFVIFVVFIYGPIILIPIFSFNDSIYIAFPLEGFTTEWYREMLANTRLLDALRNSLIVAASVSIISTGIGLSAAMGLVRYRMRGKAISSVLIILPLIVPHIIIAIALLLLLTAIGLRPSLSSLPSPSRLPSPRRLPTPSRLPAAQQTTGSSISPARR